MAVEGRNEIRGDDLGRFALDLMAVDEVHHLAVPQERCSGASSAW